MSKTSKVWFVRILGALIGTGTIVLFQNCSSGRLPAGLDQTSTAAAAPKPILPLVMYPAASSVVTSGTTIVTVSGGTGVGTYVFTTDGGQVTADSVAGYVFTAPSTAGTYNITVTDANTTTVVTPITVTIPPTTPAPAPTAVAVPITRYYNGGNQMHMFSTDNALTTAGTNEGVRYQLLSDASTGGVLFYRCALPNNNQFNPSTFFFDTTSPNCEGQATAQATAMGYIFSAPHDGAVPLYRWVRQFASFYGDANGMALDHMDTLSRSPEGPMVGLYSFDSVVGYVLPPPGQ